MFNGNCSMFNVQWSTRVFNFLSCRYYIITILYDVQAYRKRPSCRHVTGRRIENAKSYWRYFTLDSFAKHLFLAIVKDVVAIGQTVLAPRAIRGKTGMK